MYSLFCLLNNNFKKIIADPLFVVLCIHKNYQVIYKYQSISEVIFKITKNLTE